MDGMDVLTGAAGTVGRAVWDRLHPWVPPGLVRGLVGLGTWRVHRTFQGAIEDPRGQQEALLLDLVGRHRETLFGRRHGFAAIDSVEAFRRRVPVRGYDDFAPYLERLWAGEPGVLTPEPVVYFATTSGTTGPSKQIPVTPSYRREYRGWLALLVRNFLTRLPRAALGVPLAISAGGIETRSPRGIPCGPLATALLALGGYKSRFLAVPPSSQKGDDFEARYYTALRISAKAPVSCLVAVNPSTLVQLARTLERCGEHLLRELARHSSGRRGGIRRLERLAEAEGGLRLHHLWPRLSAVLCWKGGAAGFFLEQLRPHLGGVPVMELGYLASEGAFTVPLEEGTDYGAFSFRHFCEFLQGERPLLAHELEVGGRYDVAVSASHGLFRYRMEDVVEVVGFVRRAPLLRFVQKGAGYLNVTGEKVGEAHVVQAVTRAARALGVSLEGFAVAVQMEEIPRYAIAVEVSGGEVPAGFLRACDAELQRANREYEAKRRSHRLGEPELLMVRRGGFWEYRRRCLEEGAPDTTFKFPHLMSARQLRSLPLVPYHASGTHSAGMEPNRSGSMGTP